MPSLGNAILTLRVKGDEFKAGLAKAKGQADKTTKGIGAAFGRAQKSIQGAAGKVPVFGGALAALASPAGLASAAVGLVVAQVVKLFNRTVELGRELGKIQETLQLTSTQGFQVLQRVIEETNGNSGSLERTMVRMRDTIGSAVAGNKPAIESFEKLGLNIKELSELESDKALVKIIAAANDSLGPTEAAATLTDILGRSMSEMGGFANLTTEEMRKLLIQFGDAAEVGDDAVRATNAYDEELRQLGETSAGVGDKIGTFFVQFVTDKLAILNEELDELRNLAAKGRKALEWLGLLKPAAEGAATAGGDLAEALVDVTVASHDTAPAVETTEGAVAALSRSVTTLTEVSRTAAPAVAALAKEQVGARFSAERMQRALDYTNGALDSYAIAANEAAEATENATDWVREYEIRLLGARKEADMFALSLGKIRTGYSNLPSGGVKVGVDEKDESGSGRSAPGGFRFRSDIANDPISQVYTNAEGVPFAFNTHGGGSNQFNINEVGRLDDAQNWLTGNAPGAQQGAFVKGSRQGSLVRVGENFTDENITPVRGADGGGSGGGQSLTIPVQLGDETLATIYVKGKRVAVREGRD